MSSKKDRIQELKNNGYQLSFETVFNLAFENYKKIAIYAGSLILVFIVLLGIVATTTITSFYGIEKLTELLKAGNLEPANFSDEFLLKYILGLILFSCLISPLSAGLIKMAYCAQKDEEFKVLDVFQYYKGSYFKELFIATLLISFVSIVLTTGVNLLNIKFLDTFISILISFLTLLTIPLVIFSDLKAIDAISSSIIIVLKQPLILLGLMIISYLAVLTGLFFCGIGMFFTIPFMYSMHYALYQTIIGFDDKLENQ